MSDTVTIGGLPVAPSANLTGAAMIEVQDSTGTSGETTLATLRTKMFAGGAAYTASDPLTVGAVTASGQVQGNLSGGDIGSAFYAVAAAPAYAWRTTGANANEKVWDVVSVGNGLFFRTAADAGGSNVTWMQVTRTGTTVTGVTLNQPLTLTATIAVPQPTAASDATYALDSSGGLVSPGVVIANNGTFQIGPTAKFSGLVLIQDTATDAQWALVYFAGAVTNGVKIVAQNSTLFSTALGTAASINCNYSANAAVVENKTGVSRTLSITPFRTRASN